MEQNGHVNMEDVGKLVLRLALGGLLAFHGIGKILHGIAPIISRIEAAHLPSFVAYGVYLGEVVAPVLVLLGLWTRVASLLVIADIVVAVALVRWTALFTLAPSGGWSMEAEAWYFLLALALLFLGAGRLRVAPGRSRWW